MDITGEKFDKSERLCSTKIISALFETGKQFHSSLFKVVWNFNDNHNSSPVQVLFSVPKRGFRHAVTRNLIKRRLREAYRRNKKTIYEYLDSENKKIVIAIIIKGSTVPDYATIEKSVREILNKLVVNVREKPAEPNMTETK
jgi:ribonuclease P protein component